MGLFLKLVAVTVVSLLSLAIGVSYFFLLAPHNDNGFKPKDITLANTTTATTSRPSCRSFDWCTRNPDVFSTPSAGNLVWRKNNCSFRTHTDAQARQLLGRLRMTSMGDSVSRDIALYLVQRLGLEAKMPKKSHENWHVNATAGATSFTFHNWWKYHLALQRIALPQIMRNAPDVIIFNSGIWETTWFWSPQNFPLPPNLHFTTTDRRQRIGPFLENYNRTVHTFAESIALLTQPVWDALHNCHRRAGPLFVYRSTLRLNCMGSLWISKMSVAPCNETQALLDSMDEILFPVFRKVGVLVLNTRHLFKSTTSCTRNDGVHPDKLCHKKINSLLLNAIESALRNRRHCCTA